MAIAMDVPSMAPLIISGMEWILASYLLSATIKASNKNSNFTKGSSLNIMPIVAIQKESDVWPLTKPPLKAVPWPS